jgi:hypothetical protein
MGRKEKDKKTKKETCKYLQNKKVNFCHFLEHLKGHFRGDVLTYFFYQIKRVFLEGYIRRKAK